jgi:hypothetical protein
MLAGICVYHTYEVLVMPNLYDCRLPGMNVGVRKALHEFVPQDINNLRTKEVDCTRWNMTYVLPKAPSFVSKST